MVIIQFTDDQLDDRYQYLFASSDENGAFWYKERSQKRHSARWFVLNFNTIRGSLIKEKV